MSDRGAGPTTEREQLADARDKRRRGIREHRRDLFRAMARARGERRPPLAFSGHIPWIGMV